MMLETAQANIAAQNRARPQQKLRPFPLRYVPGGPRLRCAANAEDFARPSQGLAAKLVMLREAPTSQTSPKSATPPRRTNHARRRAVHGFCGTPPSRARVRLLDSLRGQERLSRSLRSGFVRSLPRGLERARETFQRDALRAPFTA